MGKRKAATGTQVTPCARAPQAGQPRCALGPGFGGALKYRVCIQGRPRARARPVGKQQRAQARPRARPSRLPRQQHTGASVPLNRRMPSSTPPRKPPWARQLQRRQPGHAPCRGHDARGPAARRRAARGAHIDHQEQQRLQAGECGDRAQRHRLQVRGVAALQQPAAVGARSARPQARLAGASRARCVRAWLPRPRRTRDAMGTNILAGPFGVRTGTRTSTVPPLHMPRCADVRSNRSCKTIGYSERLATRQADLLAPCVLERKKALRARTWRAAPHWCRRRAGAPTAGCRPGSRSP